MSTSPVTLDFSKAVPINQPAPSSSGVTLDFSKAVPINAPAQPAQDTSGQQTNDIGKTVIVPKEGESFEDTMNRAVAQGQKTTPQDIQDEMKTAPGKVATVLASAPAIGALGAAGLTGTGESIPKMVQYALKAIGSLPKEGAVDYLQQQGSGLLGLAAQHPEVVKLALRLGVDAGALLLGAKALHGVFGK